MGIVVDAKNRACANLICFLDASPPLHPVKRGTLERSSPDESESFSARANVLGYAQHYAKLPLSHLCAKKIGLLLQQSDYASQAPFIDRPIPVHSLLSLSSNGAHKSLPVEYGGSCAGLGSKRTADASLKSFGIMVLECSAKQIQQVIVFMTPDPVRRFV